MQYHRQCLIVLVAFTSTILGSFWFGMSFGLWRSSFAVNFFNITFQLPSKPRTVCNTTFEPPSKPRMIFNTSARYYTKNIAQCWTDEDYVHWKQGDFHSPGQLPGTIAYMVLTGDSNLRSRCDVIMCTFGVTIHPSRLFFVGESSKDRRIPIYDVVAPGTPRPVNARWSHQKVNRGLAVVIDILKKATDGAEVKWLMVMDDDTFVSPPNLASVLSEYDSQQPVMIGQTCQDRFCGGAGYVFSRALFEKFPTFIVECHRPPQNTNSDITVPRCITAKTGVRPTDRKEFNSQSLHFYTSSKGLDDRPQGYGRAATFHYIRPAQSYLSLWRLHQAYYGYGIN
jgi:hypothetical protein